MRKEHLQRDQLFTPFLPPFIQKSSVARREALQPCARFKLFITAEEKLGMRIAEGFAQLDDFTARSDIIVPGMPLNWLRLLGYLHEQKIVEHLQFYPIHFAHDSPKLCALSLYPSAESESTDGQAVTYGGHAATASLEETLTKVVGETLERYFLTQYRTEDLRRASVLDLEKGRERALSLRDLNGFLPWQTKSFPKYHRAEHAPINWVKGTELLSGMPAYIPAQLTFWNYQHTQASPEPVLADQTTSGAAGHFTSEEATLSALLELIERDGFMIYWLNMLSPKVLDLSEYQDPEVQELLNYFKRYRLEVVFLDTTSDVGIPCLTCAIVDRYSEEPQVVVASAAGFNLRDIALHVAREALMVYSFTTQQEAFRIDPGYKPFIDHKIGPLQRVRLWRGEDMLRRFNFFISGDSRDFRTFDEEYRDIVSPADRLKHILKRFKEMGPGYEVYLYEVKHRILDTLGYHVVRANVPQLVPLYLTESIATLDSKRLREVPEKLGFTAAKEFNPWPHPFP